MLKYCALAAILTFSLAVAGAAQTLAPKPTTEAKKGAKKGAPKSLATVPLWNIVKAVEFAVNAYNTKPETQGPNPTLPPLATADFDFKTVLDIKGGPTVNFLIFKFGYNHDNQKTNDVSFQYKPQPLKPGGMMSIPLSYDLKDELTKAIERAANQVKGEKENDKSPLPLQLKQLAITLAFSVSGEYDGGLTIPIHMVTLGGTLSRTDSSVQTVKLTFAFPDKPNGAGKVGSD